jgi:hypothetical protein
MTKELSPLAAVPIFVPLMIMVTPESGKPSGVVTTAAILRPIKAVMKESNKMITTIAYFFDKYVLLSGYNNIRT